MSELELLLAEKESLLESLISCRDAIAGSFCACKRGKSENRYWQLSWAVNKKTVNRYVKPDEVELLQKGADDFDMMKKAVARIGEINREIWLSQRK